MALKDTVIFNSGIRTFDKEFRSFGNNMVRLRSEGYQCAAVGSFKGQLHIPVIILVFFAAAEIVHYYKAEQRNVFILPLMLLKMLQQHRQF